MPVFYFLKFYLFIYFEREREREREREKMSRGGAEREQKRIPSRLHTANAKLPDVGLELTNREIMA